MPVMIWRARPSWMQRRQLADDRPDDGGRGRDPEAGEQVRPRRRQAQLAQDRAARRGVRAHQLERARVVRAQATQRRRWSPGRRSGRWPRWRPPNQSALRPMTMSGAMAMIGMVWLATMSGTSARSSSRDVDEQRWPAPGRGGAQGEADGRVAQREHGRADQPFQGARPGASRRQNSTAMSQVWGSLTSVAKANQRRLVSRWRCPCPAASRSASGHRR